MTKEQAQLILQFMTRVQLTGAEVPAFNQAIQTLQGIFNGGSIQSGDSQQPDKSD